MARLQTGGARVSVMPDPGLVDPRLLAPNFAGIGQGIGQGLSLVGQGLELQEQRAMAPKRQALADLQIAAAQEDMASAPAIRSLRQLQLQEAERQAALAGIMPVEIGTEGAFVEGGDFISPTGKYTDQVVGEVKQFYNPQTGAIETRRIPTKITPGGEIAAAAQGALAESALLNDRASLVRAQFAKTVAETNAVLKGRNVKVSKWERIDPSITDIGGQVKLVALGDNGQVLKEVLVSPADAEALDAKDKGSKSKWWKPSTWGSDKKPAAGGLTGDAEVDAFLTGGEQPSPQADDPTGGVAVSPAADEVLEEEKDNIMAPTNPQANAPARDYRFRGGLLGLVERAPQIRSAIQNQLQGLGESIGAGILQGGSALITGESISDDRTAEILASAKAQREAVAESRLNPLNYTTPAIIARALRGGSADSEPTVQPEVSLEAMQAMYEKNLAEFGPDHPFTTNQAKIIDNYLNGRPLDEGLIRARSLTDRILGR